MFTFQFDRGLGRTLILTGSYPKYVYISPYVTAIFLPPLDERDIKDDLSEKD